jgi:hypothetical protein
MSHPDHTLVRSREALTATGQAQGVHNLAIVMHQQNVLDVLRNDRDSVAGRTAGLMALSAEHGFAHWPRPLGVPPVFRSRQLKSLWRPSGLGSDDHVAGHGFRRVVSIKLGEVRPDPGSTPCCPARAAFLVADSVSETPALSPHRIA